MKTNLFLIAALFISTVTFSQSTKKGYDYYRSMSDTKMNKAELIDAIAKDANNSKTTNEKSASRNPQTGNEINSTKQENYIHIRKRPGRVKSN